MPRKSYHSRNDLEKLQSQWQKLTGLHTREEWSAAVVRAVTAAEIAANLAVRAEYSERSQFDEQFVDSMLIWANGLIGKLDRLIKPLWEGQNNKSEKFKHIRKLADSINKKRNAIVHSGEFCNEREATLAIQDANKLINALVALYCLDFKLQKPKDV